MARKYYTGKAEPATWSGLTNAEVAASAARVMGLLKDEPLVEGDSLGRWLKVVQRAEKVFPENAGARFVLVGAILHKAYDSEAGPDVEEVQLPDLEKDAKEVLRWEIVTRHLVCLFDNDRIEDLEFLEVSWRDIFDRRWQTIERELVHGEGGPNGG